MSFDAISYVKERENEYELDLSNRNLTELPQGIFDHCPNLTILPLGGNQLTELPFWIFTRCTKLAHLDLHDNHLKTLPDLSQCPLILLDVSGNRLETLGPNILIKAFLLQTLVLENNQLTILPHNVFDKCLKLNDLDARGNHLKVLNLPNFFNTENFYLNMDEDVEIIFHGNRNV